VDSYVNRVIYIKFFIIIKIIYIKKNYYMKIKGPRSIRPSKYCVELYKIIDDIGLTKNIIPAK
jgi:hypothetical protein